MSIIAPLLINSQALIVKYANEKYDNGETFTDLNQNDKWDVNEPFQDLYKYYSPAFRDLIKLFIKLFKFLIISLAKFSYLKPNDIFSPAV